MRLQEPVTSRSVAQAAARAAPAALFLLLALVLFAPAVVGGKVLSANDELLVHPPYPGWQTAPLPSNPLLSADPSYVFQPDQLQVRDALRSGRLPVWTAGIGAGRPLLAAQQSAPFFPVNWIGDIFPYWESLVWIAALKLTLAALGTFLLCRALGVGMAPAVLGGVTFGFGICLIMWSSHPHVNAYLLLPWLFLMGERLCQRGRLVDAAALAAVVGLAFVGGHPQSGMIVGIAAAAWVAYRLLQLRSMRGLMLRRAGLAGFAALLGLALAAVMLVPFAEALSQSYNTSRGGPPLAARAGLSLFFPEYWGRPDRAVPLDTGPVLSTGPSNFQERTLYIGALPAVLAIAGLFARRPRGPQLFFAGLGVSALLVALDSGPIAEAVRELPVVSDAQINRVVVVATFAGAVLAAFGLERLLLGSSPERRRMMRAALVVALLPAVTVLAAHPSSLEVLGDGVRRMLGRDTPLTGEIIGLAALLRWLVFAIAAFALVAAIVLRPPRARVLSGAGIGLAFIDLVVMGWGYQPAMDKSRASPPEPEAVRVMRRLSNEGGRVAGPDALGPNTATRWGLEDARGHELPVVERHQRLWAALGGGFRTFQRTWVDPASPGSPKVLDLFAVEDGFDGAHTYPYLPVVYRGPDGVVMSNPTALPRAFVAYGWRRSSSLQQSLDLTAEATAEQSRDQPAIETSESPPAQSPSPASIARIVEDTETLVTVDVSSSKPGHLVLLDTYYPGWRATVDGRDAEIRPAVAAFRAVKVPPGRHEVRFRYRPASVYAGAAITLVALFAIGGTVALHWGRSRRRPRPR
jgi:hypothetical protein